jgi:hypothetical protein
MEVKTPTPRWTALPRWAIDWDAVNYEWTKQFKTEIVKLANVPEPWVSSEPPIVLNIDGVAHLINIVLRRPQYPKRSWKDKLLVCFMTKPSPKIPEPQCCIQYNFYPTAGYSELSSLLFMSDFGSHPFDKNDCFQTPGIPYGDYAMRVVDQLNVVLGVKFCELVNAFHLNKEHLLRFRCTYYNKFGYYGQDGSPLEYESKRYPETAILRDIDQYNERLSLWADPVSDEIIKSHADTGYRYNIKPYGDNLVRFIPFEPPGVVSSVFSNAKPSPARFEVYANPNGASSFIDRLADIVGSLFTAPPVAPMTLDKPSNAVSCSACKYTSPAGSKYCEFCTLELSAQKECTVCTVMNPLDAQECIYCGVGFDA